MTLMNTTFSFLRFYENLCLILQTLNSTFHQKSLQACRKYKDSDLETKSEWEDNMLLLRHTKKTIGEKLIKISIAFFHFLYFYYSFSTLIHPRNKTTGFLKSLWASLSSKAQLLGCVFDTPDGDAQPITYGGK